MSFKSYLIPLSKRRTVKTIKSRAREKKMPLIPYYVVKTQEGKRFAAVSIDRGPKQVKKTYGKGVRFEAIKQHHIASGRYKVLYSRKKKR